MKIITKFSLARLVKDKYYAQYFQDGKWAEAIMDTEATYNKLVKLGDKPNPDDIEKLLNNVTWTRPQCHECGQFVDKAIQFGRVKAPVCLCFSCLNYVFRNLFK